MASSRVSTNFSTVVLAFHLTFTILAIAILSYKVYFLESELSFIRKEISTGAEPSNGRESVIQTTPLATAASSEQPSGVRNRRVSGQKDSEASSADQLQAQCVQKILKNLQVCWKLQGISRSAKIIRFTLCAQSLYS